MLIAIILYNVKHCQTVLSTFMTHTYEMSITLTKIGILYDNMRLLVVNNHKKDEKRVLYSFFKPGFKKKEYISLMY